MCVCVCVHGGGDNNCIPLPVICYNTNGIQCVRVDKKVDLYCGFNVWAMNNITEIE